MDAKKKQGQYERIVKQLNELLQKTNDPITRMATINALLHHKMQHFFWTGFYRLIDGELIAGPYQGPLACQVLDREKGVCRAAVKNKNTIIVPDVHKFEGHIACDSRSNSEIAVPVYKNNEIIAVLDIDSKEFSDFDEIDAKFLNEITAMVYN